MANIGSFKKVGGEFQGEIVTLSVQTKNVRVVPETNRANVNAPKHRGYVGRVEIGAAWSKRSTEGRDYLSIRLDDPSFNATIYVKLFDDEDGHTLIWSRARRQNGDSVEPSATPARTSGRGFRVSTHGLFAERATELFESPALNGITLVGTVSPFRVPDRVGARHLTVLDAGDVITGHRGKPRHELPSQNALR